MEIKFYSNNEWKVFSNFYPAPITDRNGKTWPTVEHAYQAMKFSSAFIQEMIRKLPSPATAKKTARSVHNIRPDWDKIKLSVMRKLLHAKFTQHLNLQAILLSTGGATLIEDSPRDYFWGCGKEGTGQSWMGKLLMELREELKKERKCSTPLS